MSENKIAFFDTKPYDKETFKRENSDLGFSISFFEAKLSEKTLVWVKNYIFEIK